MLSGCSLKQNKRNKDIHYILEDFTDSDSNNKVGPIQEWVNAVDRGGLTHITRFTSEAYHVLLQLKQA